ncbi:MAG: DUF711 family protein [Anaerolineaceae bacterium]|nr:DUF711 family protein [Anaerolineaceae bacterium]
MKIRSITNFYNPASPQAETTLDRLAEMSQAAGSEFGQAGFEVQTTRLASTPFPQYFRSLEENEAVRQALALEASAGSHGFTYLSLGPALPQFPKSYDVIPAILAATHSVFLSGIMADAAQGVCLPAVQACGRLIAQIAPLDPNGFANLNFSALANVPANAPFFPAAYHTGDRPAFALAIECADQAVTNFSSAHSLAEARQSLLDSLEQAAQKIEQVALEMERRFGIAFLGLDFSLAPYPDDCCSLGGAMEQLGVGQLGLSGSLAAAAFVADTLDRGRWKRTGFNGLMMPVLEDSVLARRSEGSLTLKDLLLYSAVCGTGLDTVPLPGDASPEQLAAVLLDVAALAVRLDKPLTARLMPVPGKKAGDATSFDFSFFANGHIMALPAAPLQGLLAGSETFSLKPRHH